MIIRLNRYHESTQSQKQALEWAITIQTSFLFLAENPKYQLHNFTHSSRNLKKWNKEKNKRF